MRRGHLMYNDCTNVPGRGSQVGANKIIHERIIAEWKRKAYEFLKAMLMKPSPSGYEEPVQAVVRDYVSGLQMR